MRHHIRLLVLIMIVTSHGCESGHGDPIVNGYNRFVTNPYTVVILSPPSDSLNHEISVIRDGESFTKRSSIAVGPKVVAFEVHKDYIYGLVKSSPQSEVSRHSYPGYFLLNTSTHTLYEGLGRQEFLTLMESQGVPLQGRIKESMGEENGGVM